MTDVWVLTKTTYAYGSDESNTRVLGVYGNRAGLERGVEKVASKTRYGVTQSRPNYWRVGPEEDDEGFFGTRPIYLTAHAVEFHE